MRAVPVALVLALAALACGRPEQEGGEREDGAVGGGAAAESGPDTATLVAFEAAGVPSYTPMRERGIGIVHFDPGPQLAGRAADTIRVTGAEEQGVIARLIADSTAVYRFEAASGLLDAPGALEFGYEEVGLPLLEDVDPGRWRVYLGTRGGEPVSGFVTAQAGRSRTLWEELLPTMPLFFVVPPDSIRFHASPDGPAAPFSLGAPATSDDPGDPGDYILWPVETAGDWMRVRAVTPSDYCFDPPAPREDTLWIRWRAPSGNPRVWFFTRGC